MPHKIEYSHAEGILQIVKQGLCHQCGACVGLCPSNTLALDSDCNPIQINDCSHCDPCICTNICSGADVDYPRIGQWTFGKTYHYSRTLETVRFAGVGHAVDETVRWQGASGGVVTQLLIHLLQSEQIKGAIVAGPHPDNPSLGKGFVADNEDDLLLSSQSRYTTTPMLDTLKSIDKKIGPYAVVALPCQVHAIRKLQMSHKDWNRRISLIIGLFCHYRLPKEATQETAATFAPKGEHLTAIRYRQKTKRGWPDNTVKMEFSGGYGWRSPYGPAQTVSGLGYCYPRGRCLVCIDALSDFSDLSIGDPWIKNRTGKWKYDSPGGESAIIVRTKIGETILQNAKNAGTMIFESISPHEITEGQRVMISEKVKSAPVRMAIIKFFNGSTPFYSIEFPVLRIRMILSALWFFSLRIITVWKPVRKYFVRLGFSPLGYKFMRWRKKWYLYLEQYDIKP